MTRSMRLAAGLVFAVLVLSACAGAETTTVAADGATAAETTTAPASTEAPTGGSSGTEGAQADEETPWWVLIIVLVAVVILVTVIAVSRPRKKTVTVTPAAPSVTWRSEVRAGYTDAHWLYDTMTEELAVWRGNQAAGAAPATGTAKSEAWDQLGTRMARASDSFYSAKADAPDAQAEAMAQAVVDDLNAVRSDLDDRAEARRRSRSVESADATAQAEARNGEQRTSQKLAGDRAQLATSMTSISKVM